MRLRVGLLAGVAVALVCAAPALAGTATTRYAEPGGDGPSPCALADPCSIQSAVETVAGPGDLVVLLPGTYLESNTVSVANDVDVITGGSAPGDVVLQSTAEIAMHVAFASTNSEVRGFTIDHRATTSVGATYALQLEGGTAERMYVETQSTATTDIACYVTALLRDSVCVNRAGQGSAAGFFSPVDLTGKLVNVTAVSTATDSAGVFLSATSAGADAVLTARNVIAQGGSASYDQFAAGANGTTADLDLANSNFETLLVLGSATGTLPSENDNQDAAVDPPLLGATFRQLPGSPTINAGDSGVADLGATDIDFDLRVQGAAVDIGADEADGKAPNTKITKKPPKRTRKRTAGFEFESPAPDAAAFECKLDGKPYKPCNSGAVTYTNLKRRRHTFKVRAVDDFENADPSPATYSWRIKRRR